MVDIARYPGIFGKLKEMAGLGAAGPPPAQDQGYHGAAADPLAAMGNSFRVENVVEDDDAAMPDSISETRLLRPPRGAVAASKPSPKGADPKVSLFFLTDQVICGAAIRNGAQVCCADPYECRFRLKNQHQKEADPPLQPGVYIRTLNKNGAVYPTPRLTWEQYQAYPVFGRLGDLPSEIDRWNRLFEAAGKGELCSARSPHQEPNHES